MQAEDWTLRGVSSGLWVAVLVVESVSCLGGQTIQTVQPMAKDAHPAFEMATIKQSDPADQKHRFEVHGHRIVVENQTVQTMIEMSYGVPHDLDAAIEKLLAHKLRRRDNAG